MTEAEVQPVYFGALYWRAGWFGPMCPPAILFYRQGWLRLETEKKVLFDLPVAQVQVHCTAFGTLKLTTSERTYALVGEAGALARSLSEQQSRELAGIAAMPGAWNLGSSTPSLFTTSARNGSGRLTFGASGSTPASGVGRGVVSQQLMVRWVQPLEQAGAQVQR